MAMIVEVRINANTIFKFSAQRIKGKPGQICIYKISKQDYTTNQWIELGELEHNYNDGAIILTKKMLEMTEKK